MAEQRHVGDGSQQTEYSDVHTAAQNLIGLLTQSLGQIQAAQGQQQQQQQPQQPSAISRPRIEQDMARSFPGMFKKAKRKTPNPQIHLKATAWKPFAVSVYLMSQNTDTSPTPSEELGLLQAELGKWVIIISTNVNHSDVGMEEESLLLSLQTQRVIQAALSRWLPPLEEQHSIWSLFKTNCVLIHCHSQQKSLRRCQGLSVVLVKQQCHYQFCTCMSSPVVVAHRQLMMMCMADTREMEESNEPVGPLDGQFEYKKNKDGIVNKHVVVCSHCRKDFSFHRSTSSLKYHLNTKHSFVGASTSGVMPGMRQSTLTERRPLSKSTSGKLTDTIARWIAKDCRPINIVEDTGLAEILKVATSDAFYKPPSRGTVMTKINELYDAKKKTKEEDLA
ncbi:putative zinc finger BED domain-containing protein 1-like [Triplophysa rosa]|uniref:Zinc finger BED domain-containing protein 1-like n=1 Tax=Triplophysa rosa TaxID=992332 RepID=A0A9W8C451_TRIRA|nr:putative zinc finger BED domain-containing protein 1-like [Triplophysa rosa]